MYCLSDGGWERSGRVEAEEERVGIAVCIFSQRVERSFEGLLDIGRW